MMVLRDLGAGVFSPPTNVFGEFSKTISLFSISKYGFILFFPDSKLEFRTKGLSPQMPWPPPPLGGGDFLIETLGDAARGGGGYFLSH